MTNISQTQFVLTIMPMYPKNVTCAIMKQNLQILHGRNFNYADNK